MYRTLNRNNRVVPIHHSDGLIAEILAFDATKTYVRKGTRLDNKLRH